MLSLTRFTKKPQFFKPPVTLSKYSTSNNYDLTSSSPDLKNYQEQNYNNSNPNRYNNYKYYNRRCFKSGRGLFLVFAFFGSIFAYKAFTGGCHHQFNDNRFITLPEKLPIALSLNTDPNYEPVLILHSRIISPSSSSLYKDMIILSHDPISFKNNLNDEVITILNLDSNSNNNFRFKQKGQKLTLLTDEYLKMQIANSFNNNIKNSEIFTKSLNFNYYFRKWNYQNIIFKTTVSKIDANNAIVSGTIMTSNGKVICELNGEYTISPIQQSESENPYSFRGTFWK
jgi:hypothetical protein